MKQRVRFIVALLLMAVQGVWAWEGSGTSTDPYLIQNLDEWKSLSYDLAHQKSHGGEFFRLTTDLDLEGISVGSETQPFSGTFDGDGHTLTDEEMQTIGEIFAPGRVRGGVLPTMHYKSGRFLGFK